MSDKEIILEKKEIDENIPKNATAIKKTFDVQETKEMLGKTNDEVIKEIEQSKEPIKNPEQPQTPIYMNTVKRKSDLIICSMQFKKMGDEDLLVISISDHKGTLHSDSVILKKGSNTYELSFFFIIDQITEFAKGHHYRFFGVLSISPGQFIFLVKPTLFRKIFGFKKKSKISDIPFAKRMEV